MDINCTLSTEKNIVPDFIGQVVIPGYHQIYLIVYLGVIYNYLKYEVDKLN